MKKLILLLIFIPLISYSQDIKNEVLQEINLSKIPAVVMGKINKNGKMEFYSNGPSRWDRKDTINEHNIFSGTPIPYNNDYFKTVFRRFKHTFSSVNKGITIYSFRHSGAIEIFKRTGSLTKLQKAMGHSSLNVSLTYLRGLEVAELKEEDMPMV